MKLKWLRTFLHVGYSGHRPLRKITIECICFLKRCSNHSRTIVQKGKKETEEQTPKKKMKIGNNISDIVFVITE